MNDAVNRDPAIARARPAAPSRRRWIGAAVLLVTLSMSASPVLAQRPGEEAAKRAEETDVRYLGYESGDLYPTETASSALTYGAAIALAVVIIGVTFKSAKRNN